MVQRKRVKATRAPKISVPNRDQVPNPREIGVADHWDWNKEEKSDEVILDTQDRTEATFHPNWSSSTAGIRGTRALDCQTYYWELEVSKRIFGTSIMFGVATKSARLHAGCYTNLLGEDCHGWGLSHKGLLWHDGRWTRYTRPFPEYKATTIGLLYNGMAGTLTYYKDGICLGVAFRNLRQRSSTLYPFVCSSTSRTKIKLSLMRRDFASLQDRCRHVIARRVGNVSRAAVLELPHSMVQYVQQALSSQSNRLFRPASKLTILDM